MNTKNLVIFSYNYPFGLGETFLSSELEYLAKDFNSIHVLPLFYGNSKIARQVPPNVSFSNPLIIEDPKKERIRFFLQGTFAFSPFRFAIKALFSQKIYRSKVKLRKWLSETLIIRNILRVKKSKHFFTYIKQDTIIYFYWGDKSSGIVPFIRERTDIPIVVRFHGSDLYEEVNGGHPFRDRLLMNLDYAVFISEMGYNYIVNRYPFIKKKCVIYKLGVFEKGISTSSNDGCLRLVSCSNAISIKRVDLIFKALFYLPFPVVWTHIGDGYLIEKIKSKVHELPSNVKINLLGYLKNSDVSDFYSSEPVDLFLNVSLSEGLPVSIMEAFSFGIPAIATDVGGTSEIVNSSNGFLITAQLSEQILAETITKFNDLNIEVKNQMRYNARDMWAREYDAGNNFKAISGFLQSL